MRWLKQQKYTSHSSGDWKSKIKLLTGLVSPEVSLLGLQMATLLCPHLAFLLSVPIPGVSLSPYKDTSHIGLGPLFMTSFNLSYLFKALSPNIDTITLGAKISTYKFGGGHNSVHNK